MNLMKLSKIIIFITILNIPLILAKIPCDGCEYQSECLKIGTQRLTKENGYEIYCNQNKQIEKAKENSQVCNNHYECRSYYCKDNICSLIAQRKKARSIFVVSSVIIIILALIVVSFFILKKSKLIKIRSRKNPRETNRTNIKIRYRTQPVKRRYSRFDSLEKQLQQIKK